MKRKEINYFFINMKFYKVIYELIIIKHAIYQDKTAEQQTPTYPNKDARIWAPIERTNTSEIPDTIGGKVFPKA